MGSRLEVPRGIRNWGTGQAGRDTIQDSSDSEGLDGGLPQHVFHPWLSREGVAADGGGD